MKFISLRKQGQKIPRHVAIIMDGNGRWAKARGLPRTQGHYEGAKRVDDIIEMSSDLGVEAVTLFSFSTENWTRPSAEVSILMQIIVSVLEAKLKTLNANNVRFRVLGRRDGVPEGVLKTLDRTVASTRDNSGLILNIAFNYGGRREILDAVSAIARDHGSGKVPLEAIDERLFSSYLYTGGLVDPDLLIRTSGECRISNFLLWQLSYAELYFTDKYWPDFTAEEFYRAIEDFGRRERRFGDTQPLKEDAP
jgi:undecaprenyl diphosphate synthase